MTFRPNPIQKRHRLATLGHNYIHIVKPRQLGFTTDYAIDMLDDALWTPGMGCAIIAHDRETLNRIFNIIRLAYEHIPDSLKPKTDTETTNVFRFKQRLDGVMLDSEIYVALKLRGTTVQRLHISESAYNKDRGELKRGAKQAVPIGGKIVEESTGNGMEDWYEEVMEAYEKQKSGLSGPMDYYVAFYAWVENPEYWLLGVLLDITDKERKIKEIAKQLYNINVSDGQLLWRRWKMSEMRSQLDGENLNTEQQFMQEYPLTLLEAFQASTGSVFDLEQLNQMLESKPIGGVVAYQMLHDNIDGFKSAQEVHDDNEVYAKYVAYSKLGVRFWHLPDKGIKYVIGVDPSDGTGGDSGSIDIWTRDTVEGKLLQCAQFFGQLRPDLLAELTKLLAEMYNNAFVGVENNMLSTVLFLKDIYPNYYMEVKLDSKTQKRSMQLGWRTSLKTRDPMIDEFKRLYEEDDLEINSAITIKQMKTFVKKENGKREHATGKSDDALFSAFIALQMRRHEPKQGRTFSEKASAL